MWVDENKVLTFTHKYNYRVKTNATSAICILFIFVKSKWIVPTISTSYYYMLQSTSAVKVIKWRLLQCSSWHNKHIWGNPIKKQPILCLHQHCAYWYNIINIVSASPNNPHPGAYCFNAHGSSGPTVPLVNYFLPNWSDNGGFNRTNRIYIHGLTDTGFLLVLL